MQTISLIAAMDRNHGIGNEGKIPWHLPADFAHFKEITMGHPIIMGRKTYESIGKPLPGRTNIVITGQAGYQAPGCTVVASLAAALAVAGDGEVFVIGGATVYNEALPFAHKLYLTSVDSEFAADTYFPVLDPNEWQETERVPHSADEKNPYPYLFTNFLRK